MLGEIEGANIEEIHSSFLRNISVKISCQLVFEIFARNFKHYFLIDG